MNKAETIVLDLFGKAFKAPKAADKQQFLDYNVEAVKTGYIIHPDCCSPTVKAWVKKHKRNLNATFYSAWSDVISRSRFQLFEDQIRHYSSTYGTGFTGPTWVVNPDLEAEVPSFTSFKVIQPITEKEALERASGMLESGIALSQDTLNNIIELFTQLKYTPDVDKVKNREAKMIICSHMGLVPTDAVECVRLLVFRATGNSLLIKSKEVLDSLRLSSLDLSTTGISEELLAEVFHRFKPILLSLKKTHRHNRAYVNKVRRLAEVKHKPYKKGYFETLLSQKTVDLKVLETKLRDLNNFKKLSLLYTIRTRLQNCGVKAFVVRNQKLFIKQERWTSSTQNLTDIHDVIYTSLVESLSKKACKVRIPSGIHYTLPTSEKSFMGNFPLGTSIKFPEKDAVIGIHWRGVDGASDIDLSMVDIVGTKYGWNAAYKRSDNSLIYSGDMTSANPEAVEMFYQKYGQFPPAIVKVNLFRGASDSKFTVFIGTAPKGVTTSRNAKMIDPNDIIASYESSMDSKEKSLGVISDNQFVMAQFRTGKGRVSTYSVSSLYTDYTVANLKSFTDLRQTLADAGFEFVEKEPDIDFTEVSKDTFINLLS